MPDINDIRKKLELNRLRKKMDENRALKSQPATSNLKSQSVMSSSAQATPTSGGIWDKYQEVMSKDWSVPNVPTTPTHVPYITNLGIAAIKGVASAPMFLKKLYDIDKKAFANAYKVITGQDVSPEEMDAPAQEFKKDIAEPLVDPWAKLAARIKLSTEGTKGGPSWGEVTSPENVVGMTQAPLVTLGGAKLAGLPKSAKYTMETLKNEIKTPDIKVMPKLEGVQGDVVSVKSGGVSQLLHREPEGNWVDYHTRKPVSPALADQLEQATTGLSAERQPLPTPPPPIIAEPQKSKEWTPELGTERAFGPTPLETARVKTAEIKPKEWTPELGTERAFGPTPLETAQVKTAEIKPSELKPVDIPAKMTTEMPSGENVIGLNKVEIETIRRNTGIDELDPTEKTTWVNTLERAKQDKLDQSALSTADEVLSSKRMVSQEEHAGMVIKAAELKNEYNESVKSINDLIAKGDEKAIEIERQRSNTILDHIDKLTEASDMSGRETARALSIRRMMINAENYDLASIVQRAQVSKGAKLTPEEITKFQKMADEYANLEKQYNELDIKHQASLQESERLQAELVAKRETQKSQIRQRTAEAKVDLYNQRKQIKADLAKLGYRVNDVTGVTAEGAYLVGKLAINYIKEGALTLDEVVKLVKADLPQLSERDIYKSIIAKDPNRQGKFRTATEKKIAQIKKQSKLLVDIENAENGIFERAKSRSPNPLEIRVLQNKLKELRREAYKSGIAPSRLEKALTTINKLQDQLDNGYRNLRKNKPIETEQLKDMKAKISDLRKTMHTEDMLADLNEQLRTGDFKIPEEKTIKKLPPDLERKQVELRVAKRKIRQAIRDQQPWTVKKVGIEVVNTARTLKATADMSATLRQGFVLSAGRPALAIKTFAKSFKSFFSQYTADQIDNAIRTSPTQYLRDRAGLYLAELDGKINAREEMFMANLVEKTPVFGKVIKASNRQMATHLNLLRSSVFDEFLKANPNATTAELKAWADWVNVASGRGNLGSLASSANALSTVFFAPRFSVSRIQTPYMMFKYFKEPRIRVAIAKDMVGVLTVGTMALGLAKMAGLDVNISDPDDPDWGKIKFGDTRVDIWAGMQQPMRLVARTINGIENPEDRKNWDPIEMFYRFTAYKLAPSVTLPYSLLMGKDMVGDEITPSEAMLGAVTPMVLQDIKDAYKSGGIKTVSIASPLNFLGVSTNTYSKTSNSNRSGRR
jgi:hypothetical protein